MTLKYNISTTDMSYSKGCAAEQGLAVCSACNLLSPVSIVQCLRCGTALELRKKESIQRTLALVITAFLLYIPANILPIMTTTLLGSGSSDTILSGVAIFWSHGDYPIALIIFIASIVIPMVKLLSLSWLCFSVLSKRQIRPKHRTYLFRMTEFIGRWSMVDVFVVAILVALVQLGNIMTIQPGPAAIAFSGVVIVTMFAAMSFDPRLIWDVLESKSKVDTNNKSNSELNSEAEIENES